MVYVLWIEFCVLGYFRVGLVVLLHSFLSLASRPICRSPARDIGGLSCIGVVVSCLGGCIGHMVVAMSRYSWMIVVTWATA